MMIDISIILILLFLLFRSNYSLLKTNEIDYYQYFFLQVLGIYHLLFSVLFTFYILSNGGDAMSYWELKRFSTSNIQDWKGIWGTGTYFIESIIYIPSKILGLHFFTGNFMFSFLTFFGLKNLFLLACKYIKPNRYFLVDASLVIIFLLPNLHFWTSGITKESLIFFSFTHWLLFINNPLSKIKFLASAVFVAIMTRPIVGLILLFLSLFVLVNKLRNNLKLVFALIILLAVGSVFSILVFDMSHVDNIGVKGLLQYRNQQYDFLKNLHANSEIPIETYSWMKQILALLYFPLSLFNKGFWISFSSIENMTSLIISIFGLLYFFKNMEKLPNVFFLGLLAFIVINFIHLMSINNLGIMMRLKSPFMILIHIICVFYLNLYLSKRYEKS